jgi:hypothetical protein
MADTLDVSRVDPLPGRSPGDGVGQLRRPDDRERRKRRQAHHAHPPPDEDDDEDRQVGTKLDIRV